MNAGTSDKYSNAQSIHILNQFSDIDACINLKQIGLL